MRRSRSRTCFCSICTTRDCSSIDSCVDVSAPDFSGDGSGDARLPPHPESALRIKRADGARFEARPRSPPLAFRPLLKPSYLVMGSAFHKRGAIDPLKAGTAWEV